MKKRLVFRSDNLKNIIVIDNVYLVMRINTFTVVVKPGGSFYYGEHEITYADLDFTHEDLVKTVIKQELCRSVCHWPLVPILEKHIILNRINSTYTIDFKIDLHIPAEVAIFLTSVDMSTEKTNATLEGFMLAGGMLARMLAGNSRKNKDYDIFYVGSVLGFTEKMDLIRKNNKYVETENSISIYSGGYKIQFIKRVYGSADQIVGGFDLDSSRFILIGDQIWGTESALWSLTHRVNSLSEFCASETFVKRIGKYKRAGFKPRFYGSKDSYIKVPYNMAYSRNYSYSLKKYGLTEKGIKIYTALAIYSGDPAHIMVIDKKYEAAELSKLLYGVRFYKEERFYNIYNKYYKNMKACMISNPTTQFTGSFFPTKVEFEYYRESGITIQNSFPYAAYMALKTIFYPKLVKYILCFM
jgi:hypothetical protein